MAAAAAASASHRAAPTAIFPSHTGRGRAGGGKSAGSAGRMCRPQRRQEEAMLAPFCLRSPARPPSPRAQAGPGGGRCGLGGAAGPPPPPSRSSIRGASLCSVAAMMLRRLLLSAPPRPRGAAPPRGDGAGPARPGKPRGAGAAMEPPAPAPRAIAAAPGFLKVAAPWVSSRPPPREGHSAPLPPSRPAVLRPLPAPLAHVLSVPARLSAVGGGQRVRPRGKLPPNAGEPYGKRGGGAVSVRHCPAASRGRSFIARRDR